jgi:hypothetical protein
MSSGHQVELEQESQGGDEVLEQIFCQPSEKANVIYGYAQFPPSVVMLPAAHSLPLHRLRWRSVDACTTEQFLPHRDVENPEQSRVAPDLMFFSLFS